MDCTDDDGAVDAKTKYIKIHCKANKIDRRQQQQQTSSSDNSSLANHLQKDLVWCHPLNILFMLRIPNILWFQPYSC